MKKILVNRHAGKGYQYSIIPENNEMEHRPINEINSLKALFDAWESAHEKEEKPEETFPAYPVCKTQLEIEALKKSFCPDGVTSEAGNVKFDQESNAHVDVLFVLKEANINGRAETNKTFWFDQKPEDSDRKRYCKKLMAALKILKDKKMLDDSVNGRFGYMNLNKRGGFGHTSPKKLKNYVIKYSDYINRQIELHSPKIIIFCGCYNVVAKNVLGVEKWNKKPGRTKINGKETHLYYIYHPAAPTFQKSLENLKKIPMPFN